MPFSETAKFPTALAGVADLFNHKNFLLNMIIPTLASSMLVGDTSFTAVTGTGVRLPADNFVATIEGEIVFVGSRTGDVCSSVTRAYEGTVAAAHPTGAQINAFITARSHNQVAVEVNAIETALGINLSNVTPASGDSHPASPATIDDEFEAGALSGSWTQLASPSIVLTKGSAVFTHTGSGADTYQAIVKAPPSAPYRVGAKLVWNSTTFGGSAGMLLRNSGSGSFIIFMFTNNGGAPQIFVQWRTSAAFNSNKFNTTAVLFPGVPRYLAIYDDNTNNNYQVSWDGIVFWTLFSEARGAWITADQIGVFLDQFTNGETSSLDVDWVRQLA